MFPSCLFGPFRNDPSRSEAQWKQKCYQIDPERLVSLSESERSNSYENRAGKYLV